jgi:pimeloyl-ACP methyl ester carboxylesterase
MTTRLAVRDETVTLNGLRFSYCHWPHDGAPNLLLLHGYTGHARTWDWFAASWQQHFNVFALDQRGHGDTDYADDYSPQSMVDDVEAFVRELGLAPVHIIGASMGGRNAFMFAGQHPDAVASLVIIDIGPQVPEAASNRIRSNVTQRDVFDHPDEAFAQARAANPRPADDVLRKRSDEGLKQLPDGRWTFKYDPKLRREPLQRFDPAVAWATIRNITCPVLLVRGAESDLLSPGLAAATAAAIPDCCVVEIAGSGHPVTLDQPAAFKAAAEAFLGMT